MKFRITLKDPDGIYECVKEAVDQSRPAQLSDEEWESISESRMREITNSKWIDCGDYVSIEIDTVANTAVVIPVKGS
jgi:hypothetical protein